MTLQWNTHYVHQKKKGGCLAGLEKGKWYVDCDEIHFHAC